MAVSTNSAPSGIVTTSPIVLASSGLPTFLLSNAANITATGLVTGLTALTYTPLATVLVWMALGGRGGVDGLYYAKFSSTTSCQLYTDAAGTITPTGLGTGAYTASTGYQTLLLITIPGGVMGPNGAVDFWLDSGYNSSANAKNFLHYLGANIITGVGSSAGVGVRSYSRFFNKGTTQQQGALDNSAVATGAAGGIGPYTINTDNAFTFSVRAQLTVATDWLSIESYTLRLYPGV